jgi:inhibitor of KinA sporulation pathway (predicted exonuclease)
VQDTDKHHEQLEEAETLDYLFVIDFECTCEEGDTQHVMEIIEFPIIVVDVKRA